MSKAISIDSPDSHGVNKTIFGFWVYLMTDCILFASLFATYIVLQANTFGGPGAKELFDLPYILVETLILLTSSFTCGLALLAVHRKSSKGALAWFSITFFLGAAFLAMELYEFAHLIHTGNDWTRSGFLSAYFTLVGMHGLHISAGLIWILVLLSQILQKGLTVTTVKRAALLSLFWHFLDIIWIFIFTFVYLMGAI